MDALKSENPVSTTSAAHAKAIELCRHAIQMTTAAGSGHPSTAMALSHLIVELMYRRMRYDLADPWNLDNDRLVLSVGHAVPIVYAAYADLGGTVGRDAAAARRLTVDDLASLRELESVLDGHPNPAEGFPFFDAATGSLGQGLSVAAGLGWAARSAGSDRKVYAIAGDGESREGQVWEAMDFIVDHDLRNVCVIFSCNGHGQAGPVSDRQSADVLAGKARAFGFEVADIDGHDPEAISGALDRINDAPAPLAVIARTVKGWGCDLMLGTNFHGKPVPQPDVEEALASLAKTAETVGAEGTLEKQPAKPIATSHVPPAAEIKLPPFADAARKAGLDSVLERRSMATRAGYGLALAALGEVDASVVALDADVSNSTYADRFAKAFPKRFIECKIAEQNMVSVGAGLSAAGWKPFASSFAKFIARAVDQIDMAAISRANLNIVGSHAGVSLGADGPSQMAVSDVAFFRSLAHVKRRDGGPVATVFNPSDAVCAYRCVEWMANIDGLCYLRTHRPEAAFLYDLEEPLRVEGFKVLREGTDVALVTSGFVTHTVLAAADQLSAQGIQCSVVDVFKLPVTPAGLIEVIRACGGRAVTVEDNYAGGLHAEVAEIAAAAGLVVRGLTASRIPKSAKTAQEVFNYVGVGLGPIVAEATACAGE